MSELAQKQQEPGVNPGGHLAELTAGELLEIPIYFSGGYKYDEERNRRVADHIKSLGRRVIAPLPNPDRRDLPAGCTIRYGNGRTSEVSGWGAYRTTPSLFGAVAITSRWQEARAQQLVDHIEGQQHGAPINAIFQSADAINGVLAAFKRPDMFRNLVLAFPAGLAKRDGVAEYQRGMLSRARMNRGNPWRPYEFEPRESAWQALRRHRHTQSGGAAVAASTATSYQPQLLHELRHGESVPGVALVLGLRDATILADRVIGSLVDPDNDIDYLLITNTGHGVRGHNQTMDAMLGVLPQLEAIKAARNWNSGGSVGPLEQRTIFSEDVSAQDRERIFALIRERRQERCVLAGFGLLSARVLTE